MRELVLNSYGKINISLDVLYKRKDNYHEIDTIMQSISIKDRMKIKKINDDRIYIYCNSKKLPKMEDNLIYKVWILMKNKFKLKGGIEVYLSKHIPIGAGLAGGSANAATTIKSINKLWELGLSNEELIKIGKEIGADVPFCLIGGTARARGIGEKIDPLEPFTNHKVLICNPGIHISSKYAYNNIVFSKKKMNTKEIINIIKSKEIKNLRNYAKNTMENFMLDRYPEIGLIKKQMYKNGAEFSLMTGSGSTVFGLFTDEEEFNNAYKYFKNKYDLVYKARTI